MASKTAHALTSWSHIMDVWNWTFFFDGHGSSPAIGINSKTGWWFGTFFIFPYVWNNHPNWRSYFSEGWANHQPEKSPSLVLWPNNFWIRYGSSTKYELQVLQVIDPRSSLDPNLIQIHCHFRIIQDPQMEVPIYTIYIHMYTYTYHIYIHIDICWPIFEAKIYLRESLHNMWPKTWYIAIPP